MIIDKDSVSTLRDEVDRWYHMVVLEVRPAHSSSTIRSRLKITITLWYDHPIKNNTPPPTHDRRKLQTSS